MVKRPKITEEMIQSTCEQVAENLGIGDPSILVRHYQYPADGQELAFKLSNREGWEWGIEIDDNLIDGLDDIDRLLEQENEAQVKKWFSENDIKQPFDVGTKVKFPLFKDVATGEIRGINDYGIAQYIVKHTWKDEKEHNWIVNFEDVELG